MLHHRFLLDADPQMNNLHISIQLTNVIFTVHNILRQRATQGTGCNMEKKSEGKDFTITTMGKTYNIKREDAIKIMVDAADMNDLTFINTSSQQMVITGTE
jgi:hypothetical protein